MGPDSEGRNVVGILLLPLFRFPAKRSGITGAVRSGVRDRCPSTRVGVISFLSCYDSGLRGLMSKVCLGNFLNTPFLCETLCCAVVCGRRPFGLRPSLRILSCCFRQGVRGFLSRRGPSLVFYARSFPSKVVDSLGRGKQCQGIATIGICASFFVGSV